MPNTSRSKSSGRSRKEDEYEDLLAEAMKTYKAVAAHASKLLTKGRCDNPAVTDRWLDVEIVKAIAANEEYHGSFRLYEVVGQVDAWQHMILRPDELAGGVNRLVASGLVLRVRDKLSTTQRLREMAPRKEDGRLLLGSAGARKWRKLVLG